MFRRIKSIGSFGSLVMVGLAVASQRAYAFTGLDDVSDIQYGYGSPQSWQADAPGGVIVAVEKMIGTMVIFWLGLAFVSIGIQQYMKHRRKVKENATFNNSKNQKI